MVQSTGRRHSELIEEQRAAGGGSHAGPLRFPNSAILWITCQQVKLREFVLFRESKILGLHLPCKPSSLPSDWILQTVRPLWFFLHSPEHSTSSSFTMV